MKFTSLDAWAPGPWCRLTTDTVEMQRVGSRGCFVQSWLHPVPDHCTNAAAALIDRKLASLVH